MSISTTIKSIQDIMRKDVGVDGDAQRIGQLVWMFFLKIYDDKETEYELLDEDYRSPIPEPLRWRNWAADAEGMTGEELLDFVNNRLFPTLKNLQPRGGDRRGFVIRASRPDEPLPDARADPDPERVAVSAAGVINRAMERLIRQNPGQYLWGYHRYKAPRSSEPAPAPAPDAAA